MCMTGKCSLCFMMILSSKDLYAVYIENVKKHCVGDAIEFMLLTRDKDSLTLTAKQKENAELAVRKAMSELDSWLARAESGLVDDLERLPYVCAAMEQLEERKKNWKERRNIEGAHSRNNGSFHTGSPSKSNFGISISDESFIASGSKSVDVNEPSMDQTAAVDELIDGQGEILSSSYEDNKGMQMPSDSFADKKMKGSYDFYQAADGQHLILQPLNMRCLVHHYGSYDRLPQCHEEAISRYLSHFSLTTTFQEHAEKVKAEAAAAAKHVPVVYDTQTSYDYLPAFSLDDFEALGSSSSNPPTMVDRPLFSNVTRLGFAAAHDSPTLRTEEAHVSSGFSTGNHAVLKVLIRFVY
ncbi:putative RING-finger protein Mag2/Rnf10 [Helianthus annuus]|uniref:RING-finger protein Mag2/Rnf10 n=1 Tax=Helianthus annuus TaxID=4232 RepID=A0A9K3DKB3_HELAN|nr:putative RING-finger protein Mag2/Rnf10 [Helianthus annuus]KAJ0813159.1 putative RING-finger protein Mag2/Rnf10 [Helianthus annuus]